MACPEHLREDGTYIPLKLAMPASCLLFDLMD